MSHSCAACGWSADHGRKLFPSFRQARRKHFRPRRLHLAASSRGMALGSELQEVSVTALSHRIGFAGFAVAAGLIAALAACAILLVGQALWSVMIVANLRLTPAIPWSVAVMPVILAGLVL